MKTKFLSIMLMLIFSVAIIAGDKTAKKDIIETAVAAGNFNTLAKALTEAGLIDALKGEGPFTVFAPTDEAFAKIPPKTLNALLADKEALKKVLLYHVVSGKVTADKVVKLDEAETMEGSKVKISSSEKGVEVNNSKVTTADIMTSNGVIHVVDTVLMPETKEMKTKKTY